jgi:ABC-2 type transport system permease protein
MSDVALAAAQARYALKGFLREPRAFVFTVIMPLFLLVILNAIFHGTSSFLHLRVPFAVYYTPAIISYQIMLAGYSSLLIAVTTERERGLLKRLRGTPMPSWVFLAGQIIRTTVVVAVTVVVLVAVGSGLYHVRIRADTVIGLAVYTVTGTACMCALGLASTRVCVTTEAASVAGPFITLILGFISGVFIPVPVMPSWLLDAGKLFPLEHLARSLQQAFATPGSTGITAIDLTALTAWGVAGLIAALVGFRWEPHDSW